MSKPPSLKPQYTSIRLRGSFWKRPARVAPVLTTKEIAELVPCRLEDVQRLEQLGLVTPVEDGRFASPPPPSTSSA